MREFLEIRDKILESDNIVVVSHVNPDGDAIGSGLALILGLRKIGKKVRFILQDKYSDNISYLKDLKSIEQYDETKEYGYS